MAKRKVVTVYHGLVGKQLHTYYKFNGKFYGFASVHLAEKEHGVSYRVTQGMFAGKDVEQLKHIPMTYTGSRYSFK